jgi:hypothetical protein
MHRKVNFSVRFSVAEVNINIRREKEENLAMAVSPQYARKAAGHTFPASRRY